MVSVYNVCGDEFRGYKAYTESGQFFVYPTATKVDVICIGGGGGGYDATNDAKTAGDGGDSRFSSYLVAYGGKGGYLQKGLLYSIFTVSESMCVVVLFVCLLLFIIIIIVIIIIISIIETS